jgi:hypothetical protein
VNSEISAKLETYLKKIQQTSVGAELEHLSGQFFNRSIIYSVARVLADIAMVAAAYYLVLLALDQILPLSECAAVCFARVSEGCCSSDFLLVVRLVLLVLSLGVGSFLSTRSVASRTFLFSAMYNALSLLILMILFSYTGLSWVAITITLGAAFFVIFFGYRFGLRVAYRLR